MGLSKVGLHAIIIVLEAMRRESHVVGSLSLLRLRSDTMNGGSQVLSLRSQGCIAVNCAWFAPCCGAVGTLDSVAGLLPACSIISRLSFAGYSTVREDFRPVAVAYGLLLCTIAAWPARLMLFASRRTESMSEHALGSQLHLIEQLHLLQAGEDNEASREDEEDVVARVVVASIAALDKVRCGLL